MTFRTSITLLFSTSLMILMAACGTVEENSGETDFGAQYTVVLDNDLPAISEGNISIEVSYTACEGAHEFEFNINEVSEGDFRVWLTKTTPSDECPDLQSQVEQHPLPEEALNARVTLTGPNVDLVVQEG